MSKNVCIKTGGDLWAVVIGEEPSFVENAVLFCVEVSRAKWKEQKIRIIGLENEIASKLKKKAFKQDEYEMD